jgi:pSer/pThr/pTyr-binding forkhead associated (FHA) protein
MDSINQSPRSLDTTHIGIPIVQDDQMNERVIQLSDEDQKVISVLPENSAILIAIGQGSDAVRFLLDNDQTSVGRKEQSDIFLDDITVSRTHAEFIRQGNRFYIRDLGSLNGTYVNQEQIERAELKSQDLVQIGKFRFLFVTRS